MAGTRQYRRKSNGQFAGASGGTKVTTGRSGGFANSAFRTRVQQSRVSKSKSGLARVKSNSSSASSKVGSFARRSSAATARRANAISKKTGMFLKKAARNEAVRHIVKRQIGVAVANGAIYGAYKYAVAVQKGNKITAATNAARGAYSKTGPRSQRGTLATMKNSRFGSIPKAKVTRKGVYKISSL